MNIDLITPSSDFPKSFNVLIEISANSSPIKYEFDKKINALFIDRFMGTSMIYPANYGFVPNTLSGDGDPCDVLVIAPFPIPHGIVVDCRALGVMNMEDESGIDTKIIAVPTEKICPMYKELLSLDDIPILLKDQIQHFFEHYKDLEKGKWVKIKGWDNIEAAHNELINGIKNYKAL